MHRSLQTLQSGQGFDTVGPRVVAGKVPGFDIQLSAPLEIHASHYRLVACCGKLNERMLLVYELI